MSQIPKTCDKCGQICEEKATYCGACGQLLREMNDCELLHFGECPSCGRFGTLYCKGTQRPYRYLKCHHCGEPYKTVELFLTHQNVFSLAERIVKKNLY